MSDETVIRTSNERLFGFLAYYGFDYKDANGYALANCFRIRREDAIRLFAAMEAARGELEMVAKAGGHAYRELAERQSSETSEPRCTVCSAPLTVSVVCSDRCARRANELKANTQKANSCSYCEAGEPRTADGFHRKAEGRYAKCTAVSEGEDRG